jgi:hypothetical protein
MSDTPLSEAELRAQLVDLDFSGVHRGDGILLWHGEVGLSRLGTCRLALVDLTIPLLPERADATDRKECAPGLVLELIVERLLAPFDRHDANDVTVFHLLIASIGDGLGAAERSRLVQRFEYGEPVAALTLLRRCSLAACSFEAHRMPSGNVQPTTFVLRWSD